MAYVTLKITDKHGNVRYSAVQTAKTPPKGTDTYSSRYEAEKAAKEKTEKAKSGSRSSSSSSRRSSSSSSEEPVFPGYSPKSSGGGYTDVEGYHDETGRVVATPEEIQRGLEEGKTPEQILDEGLKKSSGSSSSRRGSSPVTKPEEQPVLTPEKLEEVRQESLKQQGYAPASVLGVGEALVKTEPITAPKIDVDVSKLIDPTSPPPVTEEVRQAARERSEQQYSKGFKDVMTLSPDLFKADGQKSMEYWGGVATGATAQTALFVGTYGLGTLAGKGLALAPKAAKAAKTVGIISFPVWMTSTGKDIKEAISSGDPSQITSEIAQTGRDIAFMGTLGMGMKKGATIASGKTTKVVDVDAKTLGFSSGKGTTSSTTKLTGTVSEYRPSWKPGSSEYVKIRETPFTQVTKDLGTSKTIARTKDTKILTSSSIGKGGRSSSSGKEGFLSRTKAITGLKDLFKISGKDTTISAGKFKKASGSASMSQKWTGSKWTGEPTTQTSKDLSIGQYFTLQKGDSNIFKLNYVSRPKSSGSGGRSVAIIRETGVIIPTPKSGGTSIGSSGGSVSTGTGKTQQVSGTKAIQQLISSRPTFSDLPTPKPATLSIFPITGLGGGKSKSSSTQSVKTEEQKILDMVGISGASEQKTVETGKSEARTKPSPTITDVRPKRPEPRPRPAPPKIYHVSKKRSQKEDTEQTLEPDEKIITIPTQVTPQKTTPFEPQKTSQKPLVIDFPEILFVQDTKSKTDTKLSREFLGFSFIDFSGDITPPTEPTIFDFPRFDFPSSSGSRRGRKKSYSSSRTLNPWADIGLEELTGKPKKSKKKDKKKKNDKLSIESIFKI